jgi:hypothetical protein
LFVGITSDCAQAALLAANRTPRNRKPRDTTLFIRIQCLLKPRFIRIEILRYRERREEDNVEREKTSQSTDQGEQKRKVPGFHNGCRAECKRGPLVAPLDFARDRTLLGMTVIGIGRSPD